MSQTHQGLSRSHDALWIHEYSPEKGKRIDETPKTKLKHQAYVIDEIKRVSVDRLQEASFDQNSIYMRTLTSVN